MARNLTAAVETELDAANVRPILLVEFDFPSGMARLMSAATVTPSPSGK